MPYISRPPLSSATILCRYLLNATGPVPDAMLVTGGGMPADTVLIGSQKLILSFTCVSAPMFRSKSHALAEQQSIDVALVRCCLTERDILPAYIDMTLAGGGLAPFTLNDLAVYRHEDGVLWAVPEAFGAAVRFTADGLQLEMVPPYTSLKERADGIYRATAELAVQLYPQRVF